MQFLIKNGLKGMVWILVLLTLYLLFKQVVLSHAPDAWIKQIYARPVLIYSVYFFSEFFFGIFPPELFMIWAINKDTLAHYFLNLAFFASVSYAMGYLNFLIGGLFYKRSSFRFFRKKFLKESWPLLKKYGLFLIIIAALTPIPWSAVSLLVGSAGYPSTRYLKYALFRFLRFAIYGYIIYQTHVF
jgi:membrane protein DedA with SNARE-associated domain